MFNDSLLVVAALKAAQLALHRLTQVSCVGAHGRAPSRGED